MKKLVEVQEVEGEGLVGLLGERVTFFCMNYIYTGRLVGVNDVCAQLEDAKIVYETGALDNSDWMDAQAIPGGIWHVMLASIESFGELK